MNDQSPNSTMAQGPTENTNDDDTPHNIDDIQSKCIIECLVQQGFTSTLARNVLAARSQQRTIWIVDNSSSMKAMDGRRLVPTKSQTDVRVQSCTRWEELKETVQYHAQLADLLEAPTKFILLNPPTTTTTSSTTTTARNLIGATSPRTQEFSIAERGVGWIPDDMEDFTEHFAHIEPCGVTPLTCHLRNIYHSIQHMNDKIVLILATDGKPTDSQGFVSAAVDRDFEAALRNVQTRAFLVIRLCTNDDAVLQYYQRLDEQLELQLEVLDDFLDEAKQVYAHNPWLAYSLSLHRCREMGLAVHPQFRVLDWLDERPLTRQEVLQVVTMLGILDMEDKDGDEAGNKLPPLLDLDVQDKETWRMVCQRIEHGHKMTQQTHIQALMPWNPIRKRSTPWIDTRQLRRHGVKAVPFVWTIWAATAMAILAILMWHLGLGL